MENGTLRDTREKNPEIGSKNRAPAAAHTVRAPAALRHFPARFRGTFCAPQLSGERRGAAFWRVLNILYRISW